MGTPQGDVSSPPNWIAFFDILLAALALLARTHPECSFLSPGRHGALLPVGDISFADDLKSIAASLRGLKHKANVVSAFATLFDLTISAEKL